MGPFMVGLITAAYQLILRPLLFLLPAEVAQKVADLALRQRPAWRALAPTFRVWSVTLHVGLCGLELRNPVGLAAGYDKNCALIPSLASLGFGYLTVGTVTESPQTGNPKPRMFRYAKERSLINALGFPNVGLEVAARNLERGRDGLGSTSIVVSVSGASADEMLRCHRRLEPLADAVELNISSPNTAGLRVFHEPAVLQELVERVNEARTKPLMVKLPPYEPDATAESQAGLLALARVCADLGVDALTVANSRPARDPRLATGVGGLSGRAVLSEMLRMVRDVRAEVGDRVAINACGGISTGEEAWEALRAGATTVQLFTGMIYRGPGTVTKINGELLAVMAREGVASLRSELSQGVARGRAVGGA